jgi:hypothetical protein
VRNIGHFGAGVIGQEQYEAEQTVIERAEDKFGPGVLESHLATNLAPAKDAPARTPALSPEAITALAQAVEDGTVTPADPAAPVEFLTLSIAELGEALNANPDDFDRLMQLEFKRPEGPRKGAARVLKAAELAQEAPRAEVLLVLEDIIAGKVGAQ